MTPVDPRVVSFALSKLLGEVQTEHLTYKGSVAQFKGLYDALSVLELLRVQLDAGEVILKPTLPVEENDSPSEE